MPVKQLRFAPIDDVVVVDARGRPLDAVDLKQIIETEMIPNWDRNLSELRANKAAKAASRPSNSGDATRRNMEEESRSQLLFIDSIIDKLVDKLPPEAATAAVAAGGSKGGKYDPADPRLARFYLPEYDYTHDKAREIMATGDQQFNYAKFLDEWGRYQDKAKGATRPIYNVNNSPPPNRQSLNQNVKPAPKQDNGRMSPLGRSIAELRVIAPQLDPILADLERQHTSDSSNGGKGFELQGVKVIADVRDKLRELIVLLKDNERAAARPDSKDPAFAELIARVTSLEELIGTRFPTDKKPILKNSRKQKNNDEDILVLVKTMKPIVKPAPVPIVPVAVVAAEEPPKATPFSKQAANILKKYRSDNSIDEVEEAAPPPPPLPPVFVSFPDVPQAEIVATPIPVPVAAAAELPKEPPSGDSSTFQVYALIAANELVPVDHELSTRTLKQLPAPNIGGQAPPHGRKLKKPDLPKLFDHFGNKLADKVDFESDQSKAAAARQQPQAAVILPPPPKKIVSHHDDDDVLPKYVDIEEAMRAHRNRPKQEDANGERLFVPVREIDNTKLLAKTDRFLDDIKEAKRRTEQEKADAFKAKPGKDHSVNKDFHTYGMPNEDWKLSQQYNEALAKAEANRRIQMPTRPEDSKSAGQAFDAYKQTQEGKSSKETTTPVTTNYHHTIPNDLDAITVVKENKPNHRPPNGYTVQPTGGSSTTTGAKPGLSPKAKGIFKKIRNIRLFA